MKRALLVTTGTVAGLASVLTYSPASPAGALSALPAGSASGLGGPAAAAPDAPAAKAPATKAHPSKAPAARPRAAARKPVAPVATAPATKPAASPAARPTKAAAPKAPVAAKPPKPVVTTAPVSTVAKDYIGAPVAYKYGTLQVGIRVKAGKVVDAWAVKYPVGDSLPYSEMAIPILRSQTVAAQSAHIAGATGASLTTASWKTSLASALSKAGI